MRESNPDGDSLLSFPDRLRLPLAFEPALLGRDLSAASSHGWIGHFVKSNYEGEWDAVPLRAPRGAKHPVQMIYSDPGCRDFADTPILAACPYFKEVLAAFNCPLHAVRLLRLGPGSIIKEHADHDLSFEQGMVRIHIPVETNPDVEFLLNGRRVALDAGSVWYLRLSDRHSVANRGATARVHMVLDAVVNDWVASLFRSAVPAPRDDDHARPASLRALSAAAIASASGDAANLEALHSLVLQDPALQSRLAPIEGEAAMLQAVDETALAQAIPVSRDALLTRMREKGAQRPVRHRQLPDLSEWIPASVLRRDREVLIEWVHFGKDRLDPSSFEQSVRIAKRRPFNRLFRFLAPVSSLHEATGSAPHLTPAGFVFHMSRCGSTLVSRQLGALFGSVVVSEAGVIDEVLRARLGNPELGEAEQAQWLRSLLAVLGRQANEADGRLFVKFDAWHSLFLPQILRAFPDVPWIFLYRDPLEVLVSLMRRPGLHAVPGMLPGLFQPLEREPLTSREDFTAKVLALIVNGAAEHADSGRGLLLNYSDLEAGTDRIFDHFGISPSADEWQAVREVALQDAKSPHIPFAPDGAAKRASATAAEIAAAEKWIGPASRRLDAAWPPIPNVHAVRREDGLF